jgi:hypothetical protein
MKKRCFFTILCCVLLAGMISRPVFAQPAAGQLDVVYLGGMIGGNDSNSGGSRDEAVATFEKAKELLARDGIIYITDSYYIMSDETWSLPKEVYGNAVVKRDGSLVNDSMVYITQGFSCTLTLEDIVIDGGMADGITASAPIIKMEGGNLTLNDGAVIQNNNNSDAYMLGGGGIFVGNGAGISTVTMKEGSIVQNCTNSSINGGGGIAVSNGGILVMNGGTIYNNSAPNGYGGGVNIYDGGFGQAPSFTMTGGTISENTAKNGGGVNVNGGTSFKMTGGFITKNTSTETQMGGGGGVLVNGTFQMEGGSITENRASGTPDMLWLNADSGYGSGGGVFVDQSGSMEIKGNIRITGNTRAGDTNNLVLYTNYSGIRPLTVTGALTGEIGISLDSWGGLEENIYSSSKYPKLGDAVKVVYGDNYVMNSSDLACIKADLTQYRQGYEVSLDTGNNAILLTAPAQNVSVEIYKDGAEWSGNTPVVVFRDINGKEWDNNRLLPKGTYEVLVGGEKIGQSITVDTSSVSEIIHYYTVYFELKQEDGITDRTISAVYDGKAINDGDVVIGGKQLILKIEGDFPERYSYQWGGTGITNRTGRELVIDALNSLIDATCTVKYAPANYDGVDAAIEKIPGDLSVYTEDSVQKLMDAKEAVVRNKNVTEQDEVDAMARAIEEAIAALKYKDVDYAAVDEAISKADSLNPGDYTDFSAVTDAVDAVVRGKDITKQDEVDAMARAIEEAIAKLEKKSVFPSWIIYSGYSGNFGGPGEKSPVPAEGSNSVSNVQTGDSKDMIFWFSLFFVAGLSGAGITVYRRKKKYYR